MNSLQRLSCAVAALLAFTSSLAQEGSFTSRSLTPETALAAASAALQSCRKQGYQVAVAVVDRSGLTQVLLRDRFAGAHTIEVATNADERTEIAPSLSRCWRGPGHRGRR